MTLDIELVARTGAGQGLYRYELYVYIYIEDLVVYEFYRPYKDTSRTFTALASDNSREFA